MRTDDNEGLGKPGHMILPSISVHQYRGESMDVPTLGGVKETSVVVVYKSAVDCGVMS